MYMAKDINFLGWSGRKRGGEVGEESGRERESGRGGEERESHTLTWRLSVQRGYVWHRPCVPVHEGPVFRQ